MIFSYKLYYFFHMRASVVFSYHISSSLVTSNNSMHQSFPCGLDYFTSLDPQLYCNVVDEY